MDFKAIIVDHYKNRRWEGTVEHGLQGEMVNRSCGDQLTLYLKIDNDDQIAEARYTGQGCSICIASADILCGEIRGRQVTDARDIAENFLTQLQNRPRVQQIHPREADDSLTQTASADFPLQSDSSGNPNALPGDVPALLSLREFPMRQKCATMGWKILLDITG